MAPREILFGRDPTPPTTLSQVDLWDNVISGDAKEDSVCYDLTLDDIDYIGASSSTQQATKLLRFCSALHQYDCDLYRIAGEGQHEKAELLDDNSNCNLTNAELVVYSLTLALCVLVMFANTVELVVIFRYRKLRTSTNRIIISLACSDLLFGLSAVYTTVMNILVAKAEGDFNVDDLARYLAVRSNRTLCLLLDGPGFVFACMLLSILTMTAIAIEKYIAIFHPLQYYGLVTSCTIGVCLGAVWFFSLSFGFMPLMGWNTFDGTCLFVDKTSYSYLIVWASLCLFCALLTFALYARIFLTARQQARRISTRQVRASPYPVDDDSIGMPSDLAPRGFISKRLLHPNYPFKVDGDDEGGVVAGTSRERRGKDPKVFSYPISNLSTKRVSCIHEDSESLRPASAGAIATGDNTTDLNTPSDAGSEEGQMTPHRRRSLPLIECHTSSRCEPSDVATTISTIATTSPAASSVTQTDSNHQTTSEPMSIKATANNKITSRKGQNNNKKQQTCKQTKETARKISFRLLKSNSRWSVMGLLSTPGSKAIKTLAIILGSFYICCLPLIIYLLAIPNRYANFSIHCLLLLALANGLLNPLVYGFYNPKLRTAIRKLLTGSDWTTSNGKKTTDMGAKSKADNSYGYM